ncbi:MAG: ABC transporter permease [Eubacteriales bacterium]|nr:ABC transporter permease [Eubacteriales bacterium]
MIELISTIYKERKMLIILAKDDFKKRFVGSYFGVLWMFIQPTVTVLIYTFIFQIGFRATPPVSNVPYVIWLIPGIVPWFFFQEALVHETSSLLEYNFLVKKVVFKVELLPIIKLLSAILVHTCFVIIMLLVFLITKQHFSTNMLMIIYYSFCCGMFSLALGYFTSSIIVFFRDMMQIVGICIQFGIWLCPIMYDESMFIDKVPIVVLLIKLNPFYYIVKGYRKAMIGDIFNNELVLTIYFWFITIILFILGYKTFKKLRPHFADVI